MYMYNVQPRTSIRFWFSSKLAPKQKLHFMKLVKTQAKQQNIRKQNDTTADWNAMFGIFICMRTCFICVFNT